MWSVAGAMRLGSHAVLWLILCAAWNLAFNAHRIQFEHDGSGWMRMRINEGSAWNLVQASWSEKGALCWGQVCARGDLPMD